MEISAVCVVSSSTVEDASVLEEDPKFFNFDFKELLWDIAKNNKKIVIVTDYSSHPDNNDLSMKFLSKKYEINSIENGVKGRFK